MGSWTNAVNSYRNQRSFSWQLCFIHLVPDQINLCCQNSFGFSCTSLVLTSENSYAAIWLQTDAQNDKYPFCDFTYVISIGAIASLPKKSQLLCCVLSMISFRIKVSTIHSCCVLATFKVDDIKSNICVTDESHNYDLRSLSCPVGHHFNEI